HPGVRENRLRCHAGKHSRKNKRQLRTHESDRVENKRTGDRSRSVADYIPPGSDCSSSSQGEEGAEKDERRPARCKSRAGTSTYERIPPDNAGRVGNDERRTQIRE